ncbi:cilia- and flagella-associated protein 157-like [Limulus polyphemus]|uniref:Cilia- and flagella-associated protein 157 n=1 Tax=Limulus polyphemus TaxID=6850 RepID=A0ABM1S8N5_LIMPO|nr:cilia- and flagella-associated protein 157-like [Limulus polyphemus]
MPPKKKGTPGKRPKKSLGSAKSKQEELSEVDREMYIIQIKDLGSKLERQKEECTNLLASNEEYLYMYEKEVEEKEDIVEFLKKALQERAVEVTELQDRLIGLQQAHDSEKESYEKKISEMETDFKKTNENLTAENLTLSSKLSALEEFRMQRDEMTKRLKELETKLEEEEKKHSETLRELERKTIIDNDRLRNEMVQKVSEVASEFRKVSNKQVADTVKRAVKDTVHMSKELNKASEKTQILFEENSKLQKEFRDLNQQLQVLQDTESGLAAKVVVQQKVIALLKKKCEDYENLSAEIKMLEQQNTQLRSEITARDQQVKEKEETLMKLNMENDEMQKQLENLDIKVSQSEEMKNQLVGVITDAAEALRSGIISKPQEEEDSTERALLLNQLLILLDRATDLTVEELPMIPGGLDESGSQTSFQGWFQEETSLKYQAGCLGFVPNVNHDSSRTPTGENNQSQSSSKEHSISTYTEKLSK